MACRPGWSLMVVVWFVRPIHGRNTRILHHCHEAFLSRSFVSATRCSKRCLAQGNRDRCVG